MFGEEKLEEKEITDPTKLEKENEEDNPPVIEPENKKGITDIIIIALRAIKSRVFLPLPATVTCRISRKIYCFLQFFTAPQS